LFFSEYTWELCIFVLKKKTVTILQQGPLTGRTHGIQRGLEDYTVQYHPKREKKSKSSMLSYGSCCQPSNCGQEAHGFSYTNKILSLKLLITF
jgi:hypothetical protein